GLRYFACTYSNYHVVVVVVAGPSIIEADEEVVFGNSEQVEVNAGVRLQNVYILAAIGAIVQNSNAWLVHKAEAQELIHATVENGAEFVIRVAVCVEYQSVTPVKLVVIVRFLAQVGKGKFEQV